MGNPTVPGHRSALIVQQWRDAFHSFLFFLCFLRTRPQLRDVVVRGNAGDGAAEGASHRVRQLQQTPAEPHLPAWNSSRLVQLYAARVLERRLPAGGAQLSDTW